MRKLLCDICNNEIPKGKQGHIRYYHLFTHARDGDDSILVGNNLNEKTKDICLKCHKDYL